MSPNFKNEKIHDNPWQLMLKDFLWLFSNFYEVITEFVLRNSIFAIRFNSDISDDEPRSEGDLQYGPNWQSALSQLVLLITTLPVVVFYPIMMMLAIEPYIFDYERRPKRAERAGEKWFFVNGIATNEGWLDQNCKYLEARFNVGVTGLLNKSYGVFWDIVECILGRSFEIDTLSVRFVAHEILRALRDDKIETVRLFAHSQGTIITNLALKRIYLELSHEGTEEQVLLKKLEVFTFANACRDFVNPGGLIRCIEHYANENDTIARLGVLNKETNKSIKGEIFVNSKRNDGKGHLFNSYYSLNAVDYGCIRPMGANSKLLALEGSVDHLPIDIKSIRNMKID